MTSAEARDESPSESEIRQGTVDRYRIVRALAGGNGTVVHDATGVDNTLTCVVVDIDPGVVKMAFDPTSTLTTPTETERLAVLPPHDQGAHDGKPFLAYDATEVVAPCCGAFYGWDTQRLELLFALVSTLRAARDRRVEIACCSYETLAVTRRLHVRFMSPVRTLPADETVDLEQRYHDALREMVGKLVRNNFRSAPPAEESTLFGAPPDADPLIWSEQLHVSYEMRELLDDLISGRTATLDLAQEAIDAFGPGHIIRKRTGWGTHRGRVREGNEDALMLLQQAVVAGNRPLRVELYAVADGMGGHEAGEIASEITLKSMAVELVGGLNITSARDLGRDILDQEFLVDRMTEAIDQTNQTLRKYSWDAHSKSRRKPGSTLVCALALDAIMIIGHVGDSRAYKIELDGSLKRITRDHSPVQMLVDAGRITHEQAFNHPHRHQISSNIGIAPDMLKRDVNVRMLRTGESILLCSDGLCDMMLDDDLEEICKQERDPRRLARTLVETACELGGHDNVTVLVVTRAPGPPQEERESPAKTN